MGKQWKQRHILILGGSKITADNDCSHEIKRRLLLRRKVMTNLDSILKSRDVTLTPNIHLVKSMFFSVVMYGYKTWTIKKAECQRIYAFELWCWRSLLRKMKEKSEKVGLKLNIQKTKIMASGPITSRWNRWRNSGNNEKLYFWGGPKSLKMVNEAMKLKDVCSLEEKVWPI